MSLACKCPLFPFTPLPFYALFPCLSPSIHPFGSRFSVADPLFFKPLSGSLSYCSVATAIRNKKVQAYNFQRKIEGERNELGQSSFRAGILMLHSLLLALRYVSVVNRSCLQDSSRWIVEAFLLSSSRITSVSFFFLKNVCRKATTSKIYHGMNSFCYGIIASPASN